MARYTREQERYTSREGLALLSSAESSNSDLASAHQEQVHGDHELWGTGLR